MTVDLEAAAAERERLRADYLREAAGPAEVDGTRCPPRGADLFRRRADHSLLSGPSGLPVGRAVREPGLPGSTHLFFDLGHDNTLAFFDFPDLGLGPYAEVLGGLHHVAISVDQAQWDAARARLEVAGIPTQIESESSLYFSDPDGVRLELIAEDLGSLYGTPLH